MRVVQYGARAELEDASHLTQIVENRGLQRGREIVRHVIAATAVAPYLRNAAQAAGVHGIEQQPGERRKIFCRGGATHELEDGAEIAHAAHRREGDLLRCLRMGFQFAHLATARDQRGDLVQQFLGTDRLGDEVVATGLVGGEALGGGIVGGDKKHGHAGPGSPGAQTATDLVSVEPRHFDVEQHAVDIRLCSQELVTRGKGLHGMTRFEQAREDQALRCVVLDDGNAIFFVHYPAPHAAARLVPARCCPR